MKLNFTLGWLAALNLLLGLLLQWYVVSTLGMNSATDALFAGMAVPQLVLAIVSGSLMHVLVPILAGEDDELLRRMAWSFFLGVSAVFLVIAAALFMTAGLWVRWLLPGFGPGQLTLTVELTRVQILGMVFTGAVSVLWSVYHARQRFLWAEVTPILASVIALAALVPALPRYGVLAAAWASVARIGLQVLFLLPGLGAFRRPDWRSPVMADAWRRLRPLLAGTAYYKMDPLVDRYLTSLAPPGGLSTLYLGQQLWSAASQIVNRAIASPMVPLLAGYAKARRWQDFREAVRRRLAWMFGLTVAGFLLFVAVGREVLHLAIGHGGVTPQNVAMLWLVMIGLGGFLVGSAVGQVTSAAFYAFGDTKTPVWISVITFTIYVPLKVAAFLRFGLLGVAVATSLFLTVNVVLQLFFLRVGLRNRAAAAG